MITKRKVSADLLEPKPFKLTADDHFFKDTNDSDASSWLLPDLPMEEMY